MSQTVEQVVWEALANKHKLTINKSDRVCISVLEKDTYYVTVAINDRLDNLNEHLYIPFLESVLLDTLDALNKIKQKVKND